MKKTRYPKDALSLGIEVDLAQEEIEETSKVVIVSFFIFYSLSFRAL